MENKLEILKIKVNENQEPIVGGRELHEALGVKTAYKDWFPRMCEYGFIEGQDFCSILSESTGGRPSTNHAIKLDMAKEIAMIQRNEKGKQVRQYFIQVEKDFNSPDKIMARALKIADDKVKQLTVNVEELEEKIKEQKPKVVFADSVVTSRTSILVGDLAKLIKQNGYDIGQNRLFQWLRDNGFLCNKKGDMFNMPTQKSMNLKLFEVKERTIDEPNGSVRITKTPKVTGKGQVYFINKFKELVCQ